MPSLSWRDDGARFRKLNTTQYQRMTMAMMDFRFKEEMRIQPFSMSDKECVNIVRQTAFCVEEKAILLSRRD